MRSLKFRQLVCAGLGILLGTTAVLGQTAAAGRAFRFDGLNDYAFSTNFGSIMPTGAVTIELWMVPEWYSNQFVFALNPEQSTNRLALTGPAPGGRTAWERGNTNAGGTLAYLPPANLSNAWQHFALVADPSAGGTMRLYRNGVLEAAKAGVSQLSPQNSMLEIGGSSVRTQYFHGQIDELRVWNTARSQAQIQFHRHRPLSNSEPGLVAYYRFDETTGALLADSTTNGLNAVLTNAATGGTRNNSGALMDRPEAETYAVTNASLTTATLGGAVTTHYWTCGVWFAWGPVGFPTNLAPAVGLPAPPSSLAQNRFVGVSGLSPGVTYEARLFTSNGVDIANGAVQTFKTLSLSNSMVTLPGILDGVSAWGDYDDDGDLDLLLAGQTAVSTLTAIYRNDSGAFTEVYSLSVLNAVYEGAGAWGDLDNDGDLDALIMGRTGAGSRTYLLRNDTTNFATVLLTNFIATSSGSLALGDYDNDGDLDALITGDSNAPMLRAYSEIYRNDRTNFTEARVGLRNVLYSQAVWMDYSRDGRLDILLAGEANAAPITNTLIYRSLGAAGYTNVATFSGTRRAAVAWGDFDRSGSPDFIVTGATNTSGGSRSWASLYSYVIGDSFGAVLGFAPVPVFDGAVAWADYDNNGTLDLLVTGNDEGVLQAELYRHQSGSSFSNSDEQLQGLTFTTAAWGDYDSDGDVDLLMTGTANFIPSGATTRLYVNHTVRSNTPPSVPNLGGSSFRGTNGDSIQLSWNSAVDLETTNLTYNIRLSTNSGGVDIVSPHSNLATGRRLLPEPGNCGHNRFGFLTNLNPFITHYWSVQAVDGAFMGGPWTAEQRFHYIAAITDTSAPVTPATATLRGTVHPYGLNAWMWFEWGTNSVNENATAQQPLAALLTSTNLAASITLPNHPARTILRYRIAASNAVGTVVRGTIVQFETPWLAVSMSSVSNGLAPGQFNACLLALTNLSTDDRTLDFSFEGGTPAWIGVTGPAQVTASGHVTLGLVFNASGLDPGTYNTTLLIDGGGGAPVVRVPVTLHVGPAYAAKPGDLNKDGMVDLFELNTVIQYYRGLLP